MNGNEKGEGQTPQITDQSEQRRKEAEASLADVVPTPPSPLRTSALCLVASLLFAMALTKGGLITLSIALTGSALCFFAVSFFERTQWRVGRWRGALVVFAAITVSTTVVCCLREIGISLQ